MENKIPEWVPEGADKKFFTSSVMPGLNLRKDRERDDTVSLRPRPKRRELSLEDYKKGVLECDKTVLARAITLIESNSDAHFEKAQELLASLLPHSGKSFRIGITGVPGAGKSTFIEAFGTMLCRDFGKKVAVLAVDPSSTVTGRKHSRRQDEDGKSVALRKRLYSPVPVRRNARRGCAQEPRDHVAVRGRGL